VPTVGAGDGAVAIVGALVGIACVGAFVWYAVGAGVGADVGSVTLAA
jgi:hypothetical protein